MDTNCSYDKRYKPLLKLIFDILSANLALIAYGHLRNEYINIFMI